MIAHELSGVVGPTAHDEVDQPPVLCASPRGRFGPGSLLNEAGELDPTKAWDVMMRNEA